MDKAIRLGNFVSAASKISSGDVSDPEVLEAKRSAERELIEATAGCCPPKVHLSMIRQFLLIYLPPRWVAYVPHFFFFSFWAFAGVWVYEASTDNSGDIGVGELLGVLLVIGCFILFMQRWAALEWRRKSGEILAPDRLRFGLRWYHANSLLGLVSNSLLLVSTLALLLMPLINLMATKSGPSFVEAWPNWRRIVMVVIGSPSLPIAYFWSRSEFLLSSGAIRQLTLREIARRARDFRFPEGLIGASAFVLLTIWCLVLILDVRYIARIAAFPDGSVGTVGLGGAWVAVGFMFLLNGAVPWMAVYRGLPMLLTYLPLSPEGRQNATD